MSTTTITRGMHLRRRRTGTIREVAGFTTKPSASSPSDGIRRARLVVPYGDTRAPETRIRVDQILQTYSVA